MASNTLTGLINTIRTGLDEVSREMVGFIPAVRRDATSETAALNQSVQFPIVPQGTLVDVAPAATGPDPDAQTIGNDSLTISNSKVYPFFWNGEEQKGLSNAGTYNTILADQFAQGFRTIANAVETDLAGLYKYASRAYGASGTTPFGTANELDDMAETIKILKDNGAPQANLRAVLNTSAIAKLQGYQGIVSNANQAGGAGQRLTGAIADIFGVKIGSSNQIVRHTKGTGANYDVDLVAGYAVGSETIHLDTGTGTIVAGDVVTFSGDTSQQYVVGTGFAGDGDGDIVLNKPGVIHTAIANNEDMVITNNYAANMVFDGNAMMLVARAPAMPIGGDNADDVMMMQDPVSGLWFQIAMYRQYRRVAFEIGLAWGVKAIKPAHIAILKG